MPSKKQLKKILFILRWVWKNRRSDFYRKKYRHAGIKNLGFVKTFEGFKKLPPLTRKELSDTHPDDRLYIPEGEIDFVKWSSGTAGKRIVMYRKLMDKKNLSAVTTIPRNVKRAFYLTRHDSVVNKYHDLRVFKKMAVFGNRNNFDEAAKIATYLKVDALTGNAPRIIEFTEYLKRRYDLKKIKYIRLEGRRATALQYKWLFDTYKNVKILNKYSMVEAEAIGKQCLELSKKRIEAYHAANPSLFYELIPVKKRNPRLGELVITSLTKEFPTPLIRYRTGDLVKIIKTKSERCRTPGFLFTIQGRVEHNTVQLTPNLMLCIEDVEAAISSLKIPAHHFRMHIYEKRKWGKVVPYMKLELISTKISRMSGPFESLAKKIVLRFRKKDNEKEKEPTIYNLIKNKKIVSLKISSVSRDKNPDEKKHIIDHRYARSRNYS